MLRLQFGQGAAIGIDPKEYVIWAPELGDRDQIYYDQLVKLDSQGRLIYFSYNEGKESFEKAAGMEDRCEDEESEGKP